MIDLNHALAMVRRFANQTLLRIEQKGNDTHNKQLQRTSSHLPAHARPCHSLAHRQECAALGGSPASQNEHIIRTNPPTLEQNALELTFTHMISVHPIGSPSQHITIPMAPPPALASSPPSFSSFAIPSGEAVFGPPLNHISLFHIRCKYRRWNSSDPLWCHARSTCGALCHLLYRTRSAGASMAGFSPFWFWPQRSCPKSTARNSSIIPTSRHQRLYNTSPALGLGGRRGCAVIDRGVRVNAGA